MAIGRIVQRFDDGSEFEVYVDDDLASPEQVSFAALDLWKAAMAEDTED